ncbi:hypothetical protein AYI68_g4808 [Smittium mucronatum]|uniref:Uncharacterized protein n=1 Tax=Smittium mucronatum TaxID=133383 RepID=A0A1R0GW29_9FUNG|nr:hypothetical protein AYI68_g4808 [Smittium mucronatum]
MWSAVSDTSILQKGQKNLNFHPQISYLIVAGRSRRSQLAFYRFPEGQVSGQSTLAEDSISFLLRRSFGPPSTGGF